MAVLPYPGLGGEGVSEVTRELLCLVLCLGLVPLGAEHLEGWRAPVDLLRAHVIHS